jgi:hypothetical protein
VHFFGVARFAAVLFFSFVGFAASPVHAQNNKPVRSGNFYEDRASGSNTALSPDVSLTFAQSPPDKLFNITDVACDIRVLGGQVLASVTLLVGTASGTNDLGRPYPIRGNAIPEIRPQGTKYYSLVTNQIFYKVGPGRYPSITIHTDNDGSSLPSVIANCVIVGNLTDD